MGTVLNILTVLFGGSLGLAFGSRLPARLRSTVVTALGLFTLALGVKLFLDTQNPLFPLGGLLIGGLLGELWQLEEKLISVGSWLEQRYARSTSTAVQGQDFVRGFITASLLFCVGPMTILGSLQDGLSGDFDLLAIKSVLDGFASLALASTLGAGVLFSVLVILVLQGGLTLLAQQAVTILAEDVIVEMTAVGGILLIGLAIGNLLEVRKIPTSNLLPALLFTPLLVLLAEWIGQWFVT